MAITGVANGYLYNIPGGPPPPAGENVLRFDYRIYSILLLLLLKGAV